MMLLIIFMSFYISFTFFFRCALLEVLLDILKQLFEAIVRKV